MKLKTKNLKFLASSLITLTLIIIELLSEISVSAGDSSISHSAISLNVPGNYILISDENCYQNIPDIGTPSSNNNQASTDEDDDDSQNLSSPPETVIPVSSNNYIVINGSGEYNIKMDNVYIDASDTECICPLEIHKNATVNLTLIDDNVLTSSSDIAGIDVNGSLIITEDSTGTLNLSGSSYGIIGNNLTINGGSILASNLLYGIDNSNVTINNGNIVTSGSKYGIYGNKVIINDGTITSVCEADGDAIGGQDITINDGSISSDGKLGCGIYAKRSITINDGDVKVKGCMYGMYVNDNKNITINGGKVSVHSNRFGISGGTVDISGGIVKVSDRIRKLFGISGIHSQSINVMAGIVNGVLYGF